MSRIPALRVLMVIGLLLAPTVGIADIWKVLEAIPLTKKGSQASLPKTTQPETDAGQQDPADFPRPPDLVRKSYSQATTAHRSEEIATYHSAAGFDETVTRYRDDLQAAGWKKLTDSDSGSGFNRLRMIDWETPTKEAEIRFYAVKSGGTDLRVRVFTYTTGQTNKLAQSGSDATTVKTAPAANVDQNRTNKLSQQTGAAPLGSPPTDFQVHSFNPYSHQLSWSATRWSGFDLYRIDADGSTQVTDKVNATSMIDHAFLAPNTVYRLVVHHLDGSEGSLDYTYANPPQAGVVTGLKAVQTGPGKVKITWNPLTPPVPLNPQNPSAGYSTVQEYYQVTSPTYPAINKRLDVNSIEITGLPVGNHWARVAMVYGDSGKMALAPKDATVNFDVLTDRGRYRIVFLGLQCMHESRDDPLQLDGKRDEVYAGAYMVSVPRESSNAPAASGSFVRTKVMGDTNGFPGRLRAGTASDAGGIQTGDFVPSSAATAPQPGVITADDRFPLLVWEGELLDSSDLLVVSPVLFEWNKADEGPWNNWAEWWSVPNNAAQVGDMARRGARPDKFSTILSWEWQADRWAGGIIDPLAIDYSDPNRKRRNGPSFTLDADRPVGLEDQHSGGMFNVPYLVWNPGGLVLTRTNIEAALGKQDAVVYPWEIFDMDKYDTTGNAHMEGDYLLYIQIERLAPSPGSRPARRR